jgi:hypothetical protein
MVSGWSKLCKLAHAFLPEYSYKGLKLAQLLGPTWCLSHLRPAVHAEHHPATDVGVARVQHPVVVDQQHLARVLPPATPASCCNVHLSVSLSSATRNLSFYTRI